MLYEKLDYVIAIAEEQNLTRAAKKLYISQPTLTMYLNRLEESLGVQLFDRKKNPVLLTHAGKHYIEKMREIAEAEQILRGPGTYLPHRQCSCTRPLLAAAAAATAVGAPPGAELHSQSRLGKAAAEAAGKGLHRRGDRHAGRHSGERYSTGL